MWGKRNFFARRAAAIGAFSAALIAVCGGAAAQDAPPSPAAPVADDIFARDRFEISPIVCPFKGVVDYEPGDVSCGLLAVPENRERPRTREIQLHYVKIAARQPDDWDEEQDGEWTRRDDPIIYLSGGPGGQATGYVERLKDHGVRDHRDLYILEQRGVGYSQDFCPLYGLFDPSASNTDDFLAYQRAAIAASEDCFAKARAAGVDLSSYNTVENARDVKALRIALGYDAWNVWGISYGSILGQAYLREDESAVRAAVIDAIVPIQQDVLFQKIGFTYQRALDLLSEACADHSTCGRDFPAFTDRLKAAILKVKDEPIEVEAIDTELFPNGKGVIFHDVIGALPFIQLYEQDNYAALPAFIAALATIVEEDNVEAFRMLTAGAPGGPGGFSFSQGMYNAILCNDNWVGYLRQAIEEDLAEYPALGALQTDPSLISEVERICRQYGMEPRPASDYAPLVTDIRTLIVEGQMDPITPPPLAKLILPGFLNGTYVEFPFAGHGPTRSVECAGEFLTKFFDAPEGELDLSCPEGMEPPDFAGPLFETGAITRLAALAAEDPKKAALPVLWIGLSAIILLFAAPIYAIAPVARLINGAPAMSTRGARPLAWLTALAGAASIAGLAYAGYATSEASPFLFFAGLLGWAKWFAAAGIGAGLLGLALFRSALGARAAAPLPIGVLLGLFLTAAGAVGLASFLIYWGFLPI